VEPKPVCDSASWVVKRMRPLDANPSGNVHGGVILQLCDEAAATAAMRHCRLRVVTARVDAVNFREPVYVGELVTFKTSVNAVFRTSMEVGVRVEAEDLMTGEVRHTTSAYLTLVALDQDGHPTPVPPLATETPEEKRREREAQERHRLRREAAQRAVAAPSS
jgi:acyl-CoA hydrolase